MTVIISFSFTEGQQPWWCFPLWLYTQHVHICRQFGICQYSNNRKKTRFLQKEWLFSQAEQTSQQRKTGQFTGSQLVHMATGSLVEAQSKCWTNLQHPPRAHTSIMQLCLLLLLVLCVDICQQDIKCWHTFMRKGLNLTKNPKTLDTISEVVLSSGRH